MKQINILYKFLLLFLLCELEYTGKSQNLIPNPSFEQYSKCPTEFSLSYIQFGDIVNDWNSPNTGTPDYYNENCLGDAGVPFNWSGKAFAKDGQAYVGLYVWSTYRTNYREFVGVSLLTPLKKNQVYELTFFFMFATNSPYFINEIQICFSDSNVFETHDKLLTIRPVINFNLSYSHPLEIYKWKKVQYSYLAEGGEKYLVIGNFKDGEKSIFHKSEYDSDDNPRFKNRAYLLLDNFSLMQVKENNLQKSDDSISENHTYENVVLGNFLFDFDKSEYKEEAIPKLNQILDVLNKNLDLSIIVNGYTDSIGSNEYNMQLSILRAKSIADYFISKGIDQDRVSYKGHGATSLLDKQPIEKNRKVVIVFHKKN